MISVDPTVEQTVDVPLLGTTVQLMIYRSQEHPGKWYVKATIDAVDVETGEPNSFTTTWLGKDPTRETVASVIADIITHEVREQLGLDPHGAKRPCETETRLGTLPECWLCGHRASSLTLLVVNRLASSPPKYRCADQQACDDRIRRKLILAGIAPPEKP
jgi:hypothetical protein